MDKFVKVHKNKTEHSHRHNVVYKINCHDCNVSYVRQTKRQLRTRAKEHHNNMKSDKSKHSVISEHMLNCNHSFDWNNVNILDSEPNYNKRLRCYISEMLYIREQSNGINSQKDTEFLDDAYYCLLNYLLNSFKLSLTTSSVSLLFLMTKMTFRYSIVSLLIYPLQSQNANLLICLRHILTYQYIFNQDLFHLHSKSLITTYFHRYTSFYFYKFVFQFISLTVFNI